MIPQSNYNDLVLLDWEFSGFGNPGIDLATWFSVYPQEQLATMEDNYLLHYWTSLQSEGVDIINDYPFEKLKSDYLNYGTVHAMVRWAGLGGETALGSPEAAQAIINAMNDWLTYHHLNADDITVPPMYSWF